MRCYDPAEQVFDLEDEIISIDWGRNGDMAVQVTARKEKDGTFTITKYKVLEKQSPQ